MKRYFPIILSIFIAVCVACTSSTTPVATTTLTPTASATPTQVPPPELPPTQKPPPQESIVDKIPIQIASLNPVTVLAIDPLTPTTLYAWIDGKGMFKTTDGGGIWQVLSIDTGFQVTSMVLEPNTPSTINVGANNGLLIGTDSGDDSFQSHPGFINTFINDLVIDPLTPSTLYVACEHGVIKSTVGNGHWVASPTGLSNSPISRMVINERIPVNLYAWGDAGLYITNDSGGTWNMLDSFPKTTVVNALLIHPIDLNTLYAGTTEGVFRSLNAGLSWEILNDGLTDISVNSLMMDPYTPTTLYAGTNSAGIFKSTNGGVRWSEINFGLTDTFIHSLAINPIETATLYAGTNVGLFKSMDAGGSWFMVLNASEQIPYVNPDAPAGSPLSNLLLPVEIPTTAEPSYFNPTPTSIPQDWREVMQSFVVDSVINTPLAGMTLGVRRQGEPDWIQSYGFADLENSIPASSDTVYQIGALSMQFTAAAILQLVELGQLDLYAPISQYLEGLPPEFSYLNLHQLLSHTSLLHDPIDFQSLMFSQQIFTSEALFQELIPMLQFGSDYQMDISYSNYILAGLILERISGMRYPDYMDQHIFSPAGLLHTSYCIPPPLEKAQSYYMPSNELEPIQVNSSALFAAGGLCSTAGDMLLWMDALSSGNVVSTDIYQRMITPYPFADGSPGSLGYGMYVELDSYKPRFSFFGSGTSNASYLIFFPQDGLTVVMLSNSGVNDSYLFEMLFSSIETLIP